MFNKLFIININNINNNNINYSYFLERHINLHVTIFLLHNSSQVPKTFISKLFHTFLYKLKIRFRKLFFKLQNWRFDQELEVQKKYRFISLLSIFLKIFFICPAICLHISSNFGIFALFYTVYCTVSFYVNYPTLLHSSVFSSSILSHQ